MPGRSEDDVEQLAAVQHDLVLDGAETLLRFGEGRARDQPAVTRNAYGSGAAYYVSTSLDESALGNLVDRVLDDAGLGPRPPLAPGLETVTRVDGDQTHQFWMNHSEHDIEVAGAGLELLTGRTVEARLTVPAGAVRVLTSSTSIVEGRNTP